MKRFILSITFISVCVCICAQNTTSFESSYEAVEHMRLGWNLGNTLDSNSGDTLNMWIEHWTDRTPAAYERAWGQTVVKPELFKLFKEAGFNAIRVPVTWYPHMEAKFKFSSSSNSYWYPSKDDLGTNRDYDEHLLFEAYNEMLDGDRSWCFASFGAPGNYNDAKAKAAYAAINNYAQSFVDVVRATGGNNAQRNLIVSTYGACNGGGNWSSHLQDPLKEMLLPNDPAGEGHIIFEVHSYPEVKNLNNAKNELQNNINDLKKYLVKKGAPVIFGEWGTSTDKAYENYRSNLLDFARYFVQQTKQAGMGTFYWMGLSDGADRDNPVFTQPDLVDAITKGYYGDGGYADGIRSTSNSTGKDKRKDDRCYDLSGRNITNSTEQSGIIIRNGKKVIRQ